jgi:hypothetical protein
VYCNISAVDEFCQQFEFTTLSNAVSHLSIMKQAKLAQLLILLLMNERVTVNYELGSLWKEVSQNILRCYPRTCMDAVKAEELTI